MIDSALGRKHARRWVLMACIALTWPGVARGVEQGNGTAADVCDIGEVRTANLPRAGAVDFSGNWVLDAARSEGLPALWKGATAITMRVTQDADHLTPDLQLLGFKEPSTYPVLPYRLDGRVQKRQTGARGQVGTTFGLQQADGGKALMLRAIDSSVVLDVPLVNELTQRWELTDGGRALLVCRALQGPRTRTVSRLIFVKK